MRIGTTGDAVIFDVKVQPRASRPGVLGVEGDRIRIGVVAPPVDGKANEALIRLVAEAFGVSRRRVSILRGQTGRLKTLRVEGVSRQEVERWIRRAT